MTIDFRTAAQRGLKKYPNLYNTAHQYRLARSRIAGRRRTLASMQAEARENRKVLLAKHPETAISDAEAAEIARCAEEVWGSPIHTDSLLLFRAFCGRFSTGFVPTTYFKDVLMPSFKQPDLIGAKTISRRFLPDDLVPDLAYFVDGCWLDALNQPIASGDIKDCIFADWPEVYVKDEMAGRGVGVTRETPESFDIDAVMRRGNLSIQAPVQQHPFFDAFTPKSVSTLRIVTVKPVGEMAEAPSTMLSTGVGDNDVVGRGQVIRIGVSQDGTEMREFGCYRLFTPAFDRLRAHPDSGVTFAGLKIPGVVAAKEMCRKLHDTLPQMRIIGWDVVIQPDETAKIIELNATSPSLETQQLLCGDEFAHFGWEDIWRR